MKSFISRMLSESDGTPSSARVSMMLFVLAAIGWVTYLVVTNHALPDFAGLALLIGTPYAINKAQQAAGAVATLITGPAPAAPAPPQAP
jgi:hypothetical protein